MDMYAVVPATSICFSSQTRTRDQAGWYSFCVHQAIQAGKRYHPSSKVPIGQLSIVVDELSPIPFLRCKGSVCRSRVLVHHIISCPTRHTSSTSMAERRVDGSHPFSPPSPPSGLWEPKSPQNRCRIPRKTAEDRICCCLMDPTITSYGTSFRGWPRRDLQVSSRRFR